MAVDVWMWVRLSLNVSADRLPAVMGNGWVAVVYWRIVISALPPTATLPVLITHIDGGVKNLARQPPAGKRGFTRFKLITRPSGSSRCDSITTPSLTAIISQQTSIRLCFFQENRCNPWRCGCFSFELLFSSLFHEIRCRFWWPPDLSSGTILWKTFPSKNRQIIWMLFVVPHTFRLRWDKHWNLYGMLGGLDV